MQTRNRLFKMFREIEDATSNPIRKFVIFIARKFFHDDKEVMEIYREL